MPLSYFVMLAKNSEKKLQTGHSALLLWYFSMCLSTEWSEKCSKT